MSNREQQSLGGEPAANYSRFSSDQQDAASIDQQQAVCREAATRDGYVALPELEYSDEAVSGTKLRRIGLDAMLAAAAAGKFKAVYFFSLSRLARESVISLPILKTLVHVYGVRVISVSEGIDSSRAGWDLMAMVSSFQHEKYITELAANVLRGQEGVVRANQAVGDHCFGYCTEPVPGSEQGRRGRHARPRMTYRIDPVTSAWVKKIFFWFVVEKRSIRWMTQELNRLHCPKDHRATTKGWHHQYVARLLANRKYVGEWAWGKMKNCRNPLTGDIRQEPRSDVPDAWTRILPELQIIDRETFDRAQERLRENRELRNACHRVDGKFSRRQAGNVHGAPKHLLADLIVCGECGHTFHVGGAFGKYLYCPNYQRGTCSSKTTLPRQLAERLILKEVSQRILANEDWFQAVLISTVQAWHAQQQQLPSELSSTEAALADVSVRVEKLLDQLESGERPDPDIARRLNERRAERKELQEKLDSLRRTAESLPDEPNMDWLRERIANLDETLRSATPAAALALRAVVGNRIVVEEVRRENRKRHFLRGRFTIRECALSAALGVNQDAEQGGQENLGQTIELDFVHDNPLDEKAEAVKELWDQGLLQKQIAMNLNCSQAQVVKLLRHWAQTHGVKLPGGHERRRTLAQKYIEPAPYQKIAVEAVRLFNSTELLLEEIAERLSVDPNTVTAAIRWWHEQRDLPVPDGRTRRKTLGCKSRNPDNRGAGPEEPGTSAA